MERILQTNMLGDPTLGLFGFATEKYCILGPRLNNEKRISDLLGVPVIECKAISTDLAGLFYTGNSTHIIAPKFIEKHEREVLEKVAKLLLLETDFSALGNMLLLNEKGCLVSKLIKNQLGEIEKFLGIPCEIAKSRFGIIGSVALVAGKGCVHHPNLEDDFIEQITRVLGVKCEPGTANFGSPYTGACVIANSKGMIVSEDSTGIEVSRIEEILYMDQE